MQRISAVFTILLILIGTMMLLNVTNKLRHSKRRLGVANIILTILICIISSLSIYNETINMKTSELHLIDEFNVDLNNSKLYRNYRVMEASPVTYFIQLKEKNIGNIRQHLSNEYGIVLPNFNFNFGEYRMIVSVGRKIEEVKYYKANPLSQYESTTAKITFGSQYSEGQIYIYRMDDVWLEDDLVGNHRYYIMNGTKKDFVGRSLYEVNQK